MQNAYRVGGSIDISHDSGGAVKVCEMKQTVGRAITVM